MRILHTESPRIPGEGSSALGKSGPNARPKGVVDGKQAKDSCTRIWSEGVTETALNKQKLIKSQDWHLV